VHKSPPGRAFLPVTVQWPALRARIAAGFFAEAAAVLFQKPGSVKYFHP